MTLRIVVWNVARNSTTRPGPVMSAVGTIYPRSTRILLVCRMRGSQIGRFSAGRSQTRLRPQAPLVGFGGSREARIELDCASLMQSATSQTFTIATNECRAGNNERMPTTPRRHTRRWESGTRTRRCEAATVFAFGAQRTSPHHPTSSDSPPTEVLGWVLVLLSDRSHPIGRFRHGPGVSPEGR